MRRDRMLMLVLAGATAFALAACAGVADNPEDARTIGPTARVPATSGATVVGPVNTAPPVIVNTAPPVGDATPLPPTGAPTVAAASPSLAPVECTKQAFLDAVEAATTWRMYDLAPGFTANFTGSDGSSVAYIAYLAPDRYVVHEPGKIDAVVIGDTLWSRSGNAWTKSAAGNPRRTFPTTALFFAHIVLPVTRGMIADTVVRAMGDPFDGCLFTLADGTFLMTDTLGRVIGYHGAYGEDVVDAAISYDPLPVIEPPA